MGHDFGHRCRPARHDGPRGRTRAASGGISEPCTGQIWRRNCAPNPGQRLDATKSHFTAAALVGERGVGEAVAPTQSPRASGHTMRRVRCSRRAARTPAVPHLPDLMARPRKATDRSAEIGALRPRVITTDFATSRKVCAHRRCGCDLPAPSMPSKVMNLPACPRSSATATGTFATARLCSSEVTAENGCCCRHAQQSKETRHWRRRYGRLHDARPGMEIGVGRPASVGCRYGVSNLQIYACRLPSDCPAQAVDDRRVGLQPHANAQAVNKTPSRPVTVCLHGRLSR